MSRELCCSSGVDHLALASWKLPNAQAKTEHIRCKRNVGANLTSMATQLREDGKEALKHVKERRRQALDSL